MSNYNNNFPKTRAGNTLYITGLHKYFFFRWFNAPFNKSSQAAVRYLCIFQAAAVRKPHRSRCKSHGCRLPGRGKHRSRQDTSCIEERKCYNNALDLEHFLPLMSWKVTDQLQLKKLTGNHGGQFILFFNMQPQDVVKMFYSELILTKTR